MNRHCLTLGAVIFSFSVCAEVRITADVVYGHKDGMALTYDVLTPENPNGAGILSMISGGWFSFWRPPTQRIRSYEPMLNTGYTVFAVHHGSAPLFKVPDAVLDVRAAVRHIRMNANEYGVDPKRLGVTGGSAGGHLSLMLGLDRETSFEQRSSASRGIRRFGRRYSVDASTDGSVAAVVAYYPPVDLRRSVGPNDRFPALDFSSELAPGISPILFVDENDPPILLIHGDQDALVPVAGSRALAAKFVEAKVVHDLLVLEGAGHGFRGDQRTEASNAMIAWFDKHLAE